MGRNQAKTCVRKSAEKGKTSGELIPLRGAGLIKGKSGKKKTKKIRA